MWEWGDALQHFVPKIRAGLAGLILGTGHQREGELEAKLRLGLSVVTELWSYPTGDWVSSVYAADIDGDGDIEILLGSRDTHAYCLSKRGGLKWRFDGSPEWTGAVCGVEANTAVGISRMFVGSRDNRVYALSKEGAQLWEYIADHVVRQIVAADINNDGQQEVIVGSEDRCVHVLDQETGTCLWKYRTNGWIRSVHVADVDGDGLLEILAGSGDKHLYILDGAGNLKRRQNVGSKIHSIFVADVDGDQEMEILIGSDAKELMALSSDLNRKWVFIPENRILTICVADLNNDGFPEVIAGSEDKHLYILNGEGVILWKQAFGARIFSIYASDINRDGRTELLVGSEDNKLYVYQVDLERNLLVNIISKYSALGNRPLEMLRLPVQESALLLDLIGRAKPKPLPQSQQEHQIYQALRAEKRGAFKDALSILLQLQSQGVQLLRSIHVGHIRTLCLGQDYQDLSGEIIVGTDDGDVIAIHHEGRVNWATSLRDRVWTVQAGDIDNDQAYEIAAGAGDGKVHVLNQIDGLLKREIQMDDWIRSLYISELPQEGGVEIVMGSEGRKILIYDQLMEPVTPPIFTRQSIRAIYAYDLNDDGITEIIAGADDSNVYTYQRDGKLLWKYAAQDRVRGLCVRDIDADGIPEIIVGSEDRFVYVLDANGHLKWSYLTPHRVLDVDAIDINHDGSIEVLAGDGDGYLYVLSGAGDLLWQYKVSDRVRGVRAGDVNHDGNVEIAVGSEDKMLYVLQVVDPQQVQQHIHSCWLALGGAGLDNAQLHELMRDSDPYIAAYALKQLASRTDLAEADFRKLQELLGSPSVHIRQALAHCTISLYSHNPDQTRRFLDRLSTDHNREVRLSFVESLPELTVNDWHVGFEYLDRCAQESDKWVRRAVVRALWQLVDIFPQQTFRLLLLTAQDNSSWIRHESARTLAHYFDAVPQGLIVGVRTMISAPMDSTALASIIEAIAYRAQTSVIQGACHALAQLLSGLNESNVLERLQGMTTALEHAAGLPYAEETRQIYDEFYRLHHMRAISEIARYRYSFAHKSLEDPLRFQYTLHIFARLAEVAAILEKYMRRQGVGDRMASLLDAINAIEALQSNPNDKNIGSDDVQKHVLDVQIFTILLKRWREIVQSELRELRGKADLRPTLRTKQVANDGRIVVWLEIYNAGRSPAELCVVTLNASPDIEVIGSDQVVFEIVPVQQSVLAEFTIKVLSLSQSTSLRLTFNIMFDDAEAREKLQSFADLMEILSKQKEFIRIDNNPYQIGTPIQSSEMFFGREDDIEFLEKSLRFASGSMVVVLYGQRRVGKSSVLWRLVNSTHLEPHIPVFIDMQGIALGMTRKSFFIDIARRIYRAAERKGLHIGSLDMDDFERDPRFALDLFLDSVEGALSQQGCKIVVMIDEFEILEEKVRDGTLSPEVFGYLRSLMQHRQSFNFLLSGVHTIKQLTASYWSVFFNIARHHRLSKLDESSAIRLITEPVRGRLEYDPLAIEKIRQLADDQPYLIQVICRSLVEHCNRQQRNYATISDVNLVLENVMQTGGPHFEWVWTESTPDERLILSILVHEGGDDGKPLSLLDIMDAYSAYDLLYDREKVVAALRRLIERDIVEALLEETLFKVSIGLIRRWLREMKPLRQVISQESLVAD